MSFLLVTGCKRVVIYNCAIAANARVIAEMKLASYLLLLLVYSASAISSTSREVGDFALLDQNGTFHHLARYANQKAVVLLVYSTNSTEVVPALEAYMVLQGKYAESSVEFLMIDPWPTDSRVAIATSLTELEHQIPVLIDSSQMVSKSLGVASYGEVLVIDPQRMLLLYRGAIDDTFSAHTETQSGLSTRQFLDEVLSAVTLDDSVIDDVPLAQGDRVNYEDRGSDTLVSYTQQVVPVLERRCVGCHREGGVAPWAMNSHHMVKGWAPMIRETLLTMRMPPGQIDSAFIDRFVDVHFITDDEKELLVNWIDQGALSDAESDPLTSIPADSSDWALGEPDLVIEFPPQEIPATGVLDYKFVPVEIGLDRDQWVRAYEFDIGDKSSLHHVVAYTQDAKQQRQNQSGGGSRTNFGGYAPGREYVSFDENTGILLQEDMRFMVQFHYTTVGKPVVDVTRIGRYFHDVPPEFPLQRTAVMDGEFVIPPGVENFEVVAKAVIATDSYLYNIAPHMHYRGKRVKYRAEFPDGTREDLLSIPNFQHSWQMIYKLREPRFLPAGTVIVAEGVFDNSSLNPLNPNPAQEVRWGDQVWDEMFIAWMRVSEVK